MTEMDVLQSKIIQQIETYLTDENLKNDYSFTQYERECNGWIPLSRLNQLNKLSTYKYETILNALRAKRSNLLELNLTEPICVRRRRRPMENVRIFQGNAELQRTVVVHGLPRDAKEQDLKLFFNRFYPIERIKMLTSSQTNRSFNGKIHLIFQSEIDAREFVRRSQTRSIIYVNEYVLQLCNGYTLVCRMLTDCDDQDERELVGTVVHEPIPSPRVSFNPEIITSKEESNRSKSLATMKSCLKSTSCATEQILFCQNTINRKSSKLIEYQGEKIVKNALNYEFYIPEHLLHQTHECVIIAALNPHCFTVQLKQDAIEFDKFQREINEFYNDVTDAEYFVRAEEIRLNLCVVSMDPKSSETDRIWNRSQILEYDPIDRTVNLFYVDLGTWEEYVPITRLRYLIDSFHRHFVFSLNCRLAHVSAISDQIDSTLWPDDATEQFLAVIDRSAPEIELLSLDSDRCFQSNLFVINSGHYVCVNDYMIHIKKAKGILPASKTIEETSSSLHPVVALYMKLGEKLKRTSMNAHPSVIPQTLVKLVYVPLSSDDLPVDQSRRLPLVFVHQDHHIVIPDLNIYTLLQTIQTNIDPNLIEDYAFAIRYRSIQITRQSSSDLFTQLDSIFHLRSIPIIRLYSIEFVYSLLEHYRCRIAHIYYALDKAKQIELASTDLNEWFKTENDASHSLHSVPVRSEDASSLHLHKRLPFSNRLISSTNTSTI